MGHQSGRVHDLPLTCDVLEFTTRSECAKELGNAAVT